jgi:hypothetical protein
MLLCRTHKKGRGLPPFSLPFPSALYEYIDEAIWGEEIMTHTQSMTDEGNELILMSSLFLREGISMTTATSAYLDAVQKAIYKRINKSLLRTPTHTHTHTHTLERERRKIDSHYSDGRNVRGNGK